MGGLPSDAASAADRINAVRQVNGTRHRQVRETSQASPIKEFAPFLRATKWAAQSATQRRHLALWWGSTLAPRDYNRGLRRPYLNGTRLRDRRPLTLGLN